MVGPPSGAVEHVDRGWVTVRERTLGEFRRTIVFGYEAHADSRTGKAFRLAKIVAVALIALGALWLALA